MIVAVLALALVLSFATQAFAADTIQITAAVNSKITVDAGADVAFGTFEVDAANPADITRDVNVRSNVAYTFARVELSNTFPANMLSVNLPADMDGTTANPKAPSAGGFDWTQTFSLDLTPNDEWADAGSFSASYRYDAVVAP